MVGLMAGPKFFQTHMGRKFFESDFPRMVRVLEKIAKILESEGDKDGEKKHIEEDSGEDICTPFTETG